MRIRVAGAVASGAIVLVSLAGPVGAVTPSADPTPPGTPTSGARCAFDATAIAATKGVIIEVLVRQPAQNPTPTSLGIGTLRLPIRVDAVLKGKADKGPATLDVSNSLKVNASEACAYAAVAAARPKDRFIVAGTFKGTRFQATAIASIDHSCEIKTALNVPCPVTFGPVPTDDPQPWLKLAAPGLAAIIVAVLGLLLVRLRRR